jgi:hypothetical protein
MQNMQNNVKNMHNMQQTIVSKTCKKICQEYAKCMQNNLQNMYFSENMQEKCKKCIQNMQNLIIKNQFAIYALELMAAASAARLIRTVTDSPAETEAARLPA